MNKIIKIVGAKVVFATIVVASIQMAADFTNKLFQLEK